MHIYTYLSYVFLLIKLLEYLEVTNKCETIYSQIMTNNGHTHRIKYYKKNVRNKKRNSNKKL